MRLIGGPVDDVDIGLFSVFRFCLARHRMRMEFVAQAPVDMLRQFHAHAAGHQHDVRAEARERIDERMDRAAALQIAGDHDVQILERLLFLLEREEIAQRLRRMFVRAVAAIDDRNAGKFGRQLRRAVARMPDDEDVGVVRYHAHRVGEAFAFRSRTCRGIGAADRSAAEAQRRAFERQARARAGFVEQGREDFAGCGPRAARDAVLDRGSPSSFR